MNFLDKFLKNQQISNFLKIRPVGVEFFQTDGQVDMMKLIVAFCNFVYVPKNSSDNRCQEHIGLWYLHFTSERIIIK